MILLVKLVILYMKEFLINLFMASLLFIYQLLILIYRFLIYTF